jgi:hypothetical protein
MLGVGRALFVPLALSVGFAMAASYAAKSTATSWRYLETSGRETWWFGRATTKSGRERK